MLFVVFLLHLVAPRAQQTSEHIEFSDFPLLSNDMLLLHLLLSALLLFQAE